MRRVACYSASSFLKDAEAPEEAGESLVAVIAAWLKTKGLERLELGHSTLEGNATSSVHFEKLSFDGHHIWEVSVEESTESGRFFTRSCIGIGSRRVFLFLELRAGGDSLLVAPMNLDIRCPRVLRDLLERRLWSIGNTPARIQPLKWYGGEAADRFRQLIHHPDRNLPIVAVSQFNGQALSPSLSVDLARDLSGLAVVVELDEAASWAITEELGKEWSCYSGAVRLYWPYRGRQLSAFAHPLWLRQRLIERTGTAVRAAEQIRDQLRRQLLELSTYTFDEPRDFFQLRSDAQRHRIEALKQEAERSGDHARFAAQVFEEYSNAENQRLALEAENSSLRAQVQGLLDEFNQQARTGRPEDVPPEPDAPVKTVAEAVNRARAEFPEDLVFGSDVELGVAQVSDEAGPPDKVFEHLKTLSEMARIRRSGTLGRNMIEWLAGNGIAASYESSTIENSKAERQKRTWSDGSSKRFFSAHLKPNESTGPDLCIRIYFEYDDVVGKAIVGWVGRHP